MPYSLDYPIILVLMLSVMPLKQGKKEHDQGLAAASFFMCTSGVLETCSCLLSSKEASSLAVSWQEGKDE